MQVRSLLHRGWLIAGLAFASFLSPAAAAGTPSPGWKPYGLQGSVVRCLAATPHLLCAGTESDGVFCRDLGIANSAWRPLGLQGTTISWLWIDPVTPTRIFAATGSKSGSPVLLYRTVNGGVSWQPSDSGLSPAVYAVHGVPGTPTVYAMGSAVWRSDDLGSSWRLIHGSIGAGVSLEVSPTDPSTLWVGGETVIFSGYTLRSRNGGATWQEVWNSYAGPGALGDNQTADISAHPLLDGIMLSGHEGFVLRSVDHGGAFMEVLTAGARFFLDWDGADSSRAYAAGSPNGGGGHAFVSRDTGQTWSTITGALAPRLIFRLEADDRRLGVAYAATDDGVQRFYGGGLPSCLDARGGVDDLRLLPGPCPAGSAPGTTLVGDAIAGHLDEVTPAQGRIDLGEVECLVAGGDISLVDIDPPEPPPGKALFFLARMAGAANYGSSSGGLPRRPSLGDCAP